MASPNPAVRLIWVQKHPETEDNRIAIYDRDPAHPASLGNPAGELYIADRIPRLVAETASVNQKLQRSPGGPPDLQVLREDEALRIKDEMEQAEQEAREAAREEALQARQAAGPSQNMPPEVAAWLNNAGLTVTPMPGSPGAMPAPTPSTGRGGADAKAEREGVSQAVEAGPVPGTDEKPGEGTKAGEQPSAETQPSDPDTETHEGRRSPRNK